MKNFKIRNVKINQTEICLFIGLITAIICCFCGLVNNAQGLSNKIIRLHILANSDSKADQKLKIDLKDAVLKKFNFDECSNNIPLAKQKISKQLNKIRKYSNNFIKSKGYNYPVNVKIEEKSSFNTRNYGDFSLPAGNYQALKIEIGNAKGHNWWCVFVPSMCVPAASNAKQKIESVLNNNENNLINKGSKTEIRFAALECFQNLKNLICHRA